MILQILLGITFLAIFMVFVTRWFRRHQGLYIQQMELFFVRLLPYFDTPQASFDYPKDGYAAFTIMEKQQAMSYFSYSKSIGDSMIFFTAFSVSIKVPKDFSLKLEYWRSAKARKEDTRKKEVLDFQPEILASGGDFYEYFKLEASPQKQLNQILTLPIKHKLVQFAMDRIFTGHIEIKEQRLTYHYPFPITKQKQRKEFEPIALFLLEWGDISL